MRNDGLNAHVENSTSNWEYCIYTSSFRPIYIYIYIQYTYICIYIYYETLLVMIQSSDINVFIDTLAYS